MTQLFVTIGNNADSDKFTTCHASGFGWQRRKKAVALSVAVRYLMGKNFTGITS
jgi:hypothetical protein